MCLGIPGKVVEIYEEHDVPMGKVEFGGVFKQVCLSLTPTVALDQYVIVHVGFSLQVIDESEARQIFAFLESMDDLDELEENDLALNQGETDTGSESLP